MKWYWILAIVVGAMALGFGVSYLINGSKDKAPETVEEADKELEEAVDNAAKARARARKAA